MAGANREWRNSWFGRVLGSVFGLLMLGIVLFVSPDDGSSRTSWDQLFFDLVVLLGGLAVLIAVWTSRLELVDETLIATQYGRTWSMAMADVVSVEPAFWPCTGLIITSRDNRKIRTLVTGSAGDELWEPRADRICDELEHLARMARG